MQATGLSEREAQTLMLLEDKILQLARRTLVLLLIEETRLEVGDSAAASIASCKIAISLSDGSGVTLLRKDLGIDLV